MCTARFSGSKDRSPYSAIRVALATAACIPNRLRRAWCPRAPKAACWACCRESSARFRRPRRSSSSSGKGEPLDWPPAAVRRAGDEIPRVEAAEESGMPRLRRTSNRDEADRLRRILRHTRRGGSHYRDECSGNHSARAEDAARSRRRHLHSRRARGRTNIRSATCKDI